MADRKYGWMGLKVPLSNLNDPDYCEYGCFVCTSAREGKRVAKFVQKIETLVTFGGCWWGRARYRKYGVKPDQKIPDQ